MQKYQAIFQIKRGEEWLDFCREGFDNPNDAAPWVARLGREYGAPFRARVEHWPQLGEPREATRVIE